MDRPIDSTEDLVRRHGDYLRRLALALVRDEAAAQDVAQETWRVALEGRDARVEHPRAWLRGIARRVAWRRVREDRRRANREAEVARAESGGDEPTLAWGDALQAALRRLDAPYRETVVQRYLKGLPPREIARRTGVPLETVKSRLKRGLAALREDLDRQHGGERRAWAVGLVGALELPRAGALDGPVARGPQSAPASETLPAPTSLTMGIKILASVAVLASVSTLALRDTASPDRAAVDVQRGGAERSSSTTSLARVDGVAASRTEEHLGAAAASAATASGDTPLAMRFEVRDHLGDPLPGVEVQIAPPDHPFVAAGRTDADGRLSAAWASRTPTMTVDVAFAVWGVEDIGGLHRVEVRAGVPRDVVLQVEPSSSSRFELKAAEATADDAVDRARPVRGDSPNTSEGWVEIAAEPIETLLEDVTLGLDDITNEVELLEFALEGITRGGLGYGSFDETFEVADTKLPGMATVEGVVTDEFGRVAPRYPVRYSVDGEPARDVVRTDAEGRYRVELPAQGARLRVGAGSDLVEWAGKLEEGEVLRWSPRVRRGRDAQVQLASREGHDVDGVVVQVRHDDGRTLWIGRAASDDSGLATIHGCPAERVDVDLLPPEKSVAVALVTLEDVPTGSPWEHELYEEGLAAPLPFELMPRDADRAEDCATELIVLDASRTWGQRMRVPGTLGSSVRGVLPAGSWWLELATLRTGRREIGAVHALGEQPIALGGVELGPVGELALGAAGGPGSTVLVQWLRDDVDSRTAEVESETLPRVLTVPPGRYRVTVTPDAGEGRSKVVEVGAGERIDV
ncbi:MAG: sigma-70 family RNA polymerase sigma factor [Planctomycetota bacterium]